MSLTPSQPSERTVVAHGFSPEEIEHLNRLILGHAQSSLPIAFAAAEKRHLSLPLQKLVALFHEGTEGEPPEALDPERSPARIPGRENQRVLYLHGFDKKELFGLVDLVKKNVSNPKGIAFATSTLNNLSMPLERLVREVWKDHDYMEERRIAQKEGRPLPPPPE
ncbi:MAG: DUF3783 domain-containing protein, partial [Spirochaetales bacterium]|nr:DUF3783 domain-containing protein [Spirochaetales bacterium]